MEHLGLFAQLMDFLPWTILAEADIENPVKPVLDAPVGAHRCRELLSTQVTGTDVIAPLQARLLVADRADGIDSADGLALRPIGPIDDALRWKYRGDLTDESAMGLLDLALSIDPLSFMLIDEGASAGAAPR